MACLLGLALLLLGRQILLGGGFYDLDVLLQSLPVYSWYAEGLRQGRIPIWSRDLLGGYPLAFAQYGFFYPPDMLLFRLLDAARAFHLSLALHLGLAGVCTYWYCRVLGLRRLPSLLAAVVYQMGNEALAWPVNGFLTRTLFLPPALLATIELTFRRNSRWWLLMPFLVGGALLGGYAQFVLFALAMAGPYAAVAAIAMRRTQKEEERGGGLGTPQTPTERARGPLCTPPLGPRANWGHPKPRHGACGSLCTPPLVTHHPSLITRVALLAVGVGLGFGLAAVRVAPTLAVTALSTRSEGMDVGRSAVDSIEPWALVVGHLLPAVFELPGMAVARPDYLAPPALLLAALALGAFRRLDRAAWFGAGLAVVATLLSLGKAAPFYALLLQVPFFSYFRGPNRFSLLAALGIAVLAAYALDRRLASDLPRHRRWSLAAAALAAGAALLAVLGLATSVAFQFGRDPLSNTVRDAVAVGGLDALNVLRPRVAIALLALVVAPLLIALCARGRISHRALEGWAVALSAVVLFTLGWIEKPWLPPDSLHHPPALLQRLREDPSAFRVFSYASRISTHNVRTFYTPKVGRAPSQEFEERYLRQFIPPNLGMLFGVATEDGYEVMQTRRQALVAAYLGSERDDWAALFSDGDRMEWKLHDRSMHDRLSLMAALNVRYLLYAFPTEDPRLEPVDQVAVPIYPDLDPDLVARVHLYRLENAVPRAFVVPEALVMPGEKDVLETLSAGTVDPRRRVILETAPATPGGPLLTLEGSTVEIADYRDEQVAVRARTDGAGFLVLMDFLLPGWTATVDGMEEPILSANFAGRAVPIRAAGEHLIVFSYEAPLLRQGLAISLLSLGVLMLTSLAGKASSWRASR